jgi:hypothetical protein
MRPVRRQKNLIFVLSTKIFYEADKSNKHPKASKSHAPHPLCVEIFSHEKICTIFNIYYSDSSFNILYDK